MLPLSGRHRRKCDRGGISDEIEKRAPAAARPRSISR